MKEKVSVIIPLYNASNYLNKCISSVLNQTYKNIEIIVVNDGSTDNSFELCTNWAKRDNRIVLINKENGGVSSARNLALERSRGDLVLFLDADDYLDACAIEKLIEKKNKTNTKVVFSAFRIFDDSNNSVISSAYTNEIIPKEQAIEQCFQHKNTWFYATWAKLFSREIISENGLIKKFDETLLVGEDYKC